MNVDQLHELLVESLEHEQGGKLTYEVALECVIHDDLRKAFEEYLEQTNTHITILEQVFQGLGLDIDTETPHRKCVRDVAAAMVTAMTKAKEELDEVGAELFACECVVLTETKDHFTWQLLKECVGQLTGAEWRVLQDAVDKVEDEEDRHLYHSRGWCRELWMQALGMKGVLPPPEAREDVTTAIGAARAEQARSSMR